MLFTILIVRNQVFFFIWNQLFCQDLWRFMFFTKIFFSLSLFQVTTYSQQNKMNAANLAVVFGPSLIWSRNQASLTAIDVINAFTQILITHYECIFTK